MTPDPRLLVPATRELLDGWCGPVVDDQGNDAVFRGLHGRAQVYVEDYTSNGNEGWLPLADVRLRLDLSRAECRDRVARVGFGTVTEHRLTWLASHHCNVFRRPGHIAAAASEACAKRFGGAFVPALADLDPDDDTRVSDGSRLVDLLALAAVWQEVSRGQ